MGILAALWLLLGVVLPALAAPPQADFYVAPEGNDAWSGLLAAPNARQNDGPFASLQRAQMAVRQLRKRQPDRRTPIRVLLRGGTYSIPQPEAFTRPEPLVFTPEDSGTPDSPTIYAAYPGEQPILSGGERLRGWKTDAQGRWQTTLDDVRNGTWKFSQLFVDDQRRFRPRLPKDGYYFIAEALPPSPEAAGKGFDQFRFQPGEIHADWQNLNDVEALCFQTWTMARLRIRSVDEASHTVRFSGNTRGLEPYAALPKGNRYLLENVKEALDRPGEWYLDSKSGVLTYLPMPGEEIQKTIVMAPRLERLLELKGDAEKRALVQHLRFEGLTFAYANWNAPTEGNAFAQAEVNLGGAITAEGARNCVLSGCAVTHVGTYAIEWGAGCQNNIVEDCELTDLGAGGVKIGEMGPRDDEALVASHNVVRNCLIAHGGRIHPAAVGVWIGHSPYNRIEHNDIDDFYYTGISVGWSWGYGRSLAHDNAIEFNHISHIGQGVLSDMGGIYTLGLAPGTTLRNNLIHDVESYDYGGWGIYPDEGSTGLLIENNVVYRTKSGGFHQHYGKENRVLNNIFALARDGQIIRTRAEDHLSFTFQHNIVYWKEGPLLGSNWTGNNYALDNNLYWDASGSPVLFAGMALEQWRQKGQDVHSLIADPHFVDPEEGDFRLKPGSPAFQLGFQPIDTQKIGHQGSHKSRPPHGSHPPQRAFPPPPPPQPIVEDFENTPVGAKMSGATTVEENDRATARVTDETAAAGRHSLKFIDAAGQKFSYNPHVYFSPRFTQGLLKAHFALRLEPGAVFFYEWRDNATPYHVGPSLRIGNDGTLVANGKRLMRLPQSQWIRFDIVCGLGDKATGTYDLAVSLSGRTPPNQFHALPCSREFRSLRWYGFVADGDESGVFYIDDIRLQPLP